MSLQVWLPLNGSLNNQGLTDINIINNGATINNTGKIGQCYYFNASSYLNESTYDWTNFNTTEFSLCCWYKEPSPVASGNSQIICIGTSSGWNNIRIGLLRRTSNGYPMFSVSDGSNAVQYNCMATTFSFDTWNHIVCTYNNGEIKIYLNGILNKTYTTTIVPVLNSSQHLGVGAASNGAEKLTGYLNDVRIYDHCLSQKEVEEIAKGLVLHYKLDSIGNRNGNPNLGNTSANYSNQQLENPYAAGSWGGDTGTVTYYMSGGYNNLPYKVYHKTATGSGGMYRKTDNDIIIEAGKTYTFSCWIKSSRDYTESAYGFNINRGSDNYYINYGASLVLTTDWKLFSKTFTATTDQAGAYGEMSIIYDDNITDYYVYYSGFKVEEGTEATPWVNPIDNNQSTIYDSSGYGNNGTINNISITNDTREYLNSIKFDGSTSYIKINENKVFAQGAEAMTINLWAKNTTWSNGANMKFFSCTETGGFNCEAGNSGYVRFPVNVYTNAEQSNYAYRHDSNEVQAAALTPNEWNMITWVYDSAGTKTYINGVLHHTYTNTSYGIHFNMNARLFLGCEANTASPSSPYYNGYMSDFRMYYTALSQEAILELYHTSVTIDNNGNVYAREVIE